MTTLNTRSKVLLLFFAISAICTVGACHYGPVVSSFPPAHSYKGAEADIVTNMKRHFTAELIEVRDSGLVLLADAKLELFSYTSIQSLKVTGMNKRLEIGGRRIPSPEDRGKLRLVSRFPQGLTPELLTKLLDTYGQTELAAGNP